jgi:hypothetical protein
MTRIQFLEHPFQAKVLEHLPLVEPGENASGRSIYLLLRNASFFGLLFKQPVCRHRGTSSAQSLFAAIANHQSRSVSRPTFIIGPDYVAAFNGGDQVAF